MTKIPNDTTQLPVTNAFLADLLQRRGKKSIGSDSVWFLELHGARVVQPIAFEPDANTYRGAYYYNAITNTLYRKVVTNNSAGVLKAHWQKISQ